MPLFKKLRFGHILSLTIWIDSKPIVWDSSVFYPLVHKFEVCTQASLTCTAQLAQPKCHAPPMHRCHARTAQLARHPKPNFNPTNSIRTGTTLYSCFITHVKGVLQQKAHKVGGPLSSPTCQTIKSCHFMWCPQR